MDNSEHEFSYSRADFERVRVAIYKRAGINLTESKRQLVYSRLARRLRALQLDDFASYLAFMETNLQEQEEFVNALTTNLTAFFREPHHFDILADYVEPFKREGRSMRIWCAAASTGEEPYSIAMTLAEAFGTYTPPVEIIASDIDSKCLREASAGIYSLQKLESVSLAQKQQFFQRGTGSNKGNARVIPALKKMIEFRQLNLLDEQWSVKPAFDVIFCRNVMIYFDKQTQLKLLERMVKLLTPDGLYVAGHSESFNQATNLVRLVAKTTYVPAAKYSQERR